MVSIFLAYLPIVLLVYLMTKQNSMPSFRALPLIAALTYGITLFGFGFGLREVHAAVLNGLLVAWTPISIIAGAIFFFRIMEHTGALADVKQWLNGISTNPIAQLMIIAWAFQFLVEGASGFGTPAAIAAPILVGLGFPAIRVAILCLILNSVPVSFGAVGTPVWFGLSLMPLSNEALTAIAVNTAWLNSIAALPIVVVALLFIAPLAQIRRNAIFIVLSTLSCCLPYLVVAHISYEFPSLIGGLIGLIVTVGLAKLNIGLEAASNDKTYETVPLRQLIRASFPIWGAVALLIITRIPQLGIKSVLQLAEPSWSLTLGDLGVFSISASLVFSLSNILGTGESWSHSFLYIPSVIPFVIIGLVTLYLYPDASKNLRASTSVTLQQMRHPTVTLLGALVFVNLMMMGKENSIVNQIGQNLANMSGNHWPLVAHYLGALGSFFSGSATISNLTFGGVQFAISESLDLNTSVILSLQSVGAAMGNMICINNIVAVASVLALSNQEGYILKRTAIAVLVYGMAVTLATLLIF